MISEVLTHLWQSTLFAIGAGLLTLVFRKNGAHVRFGLWLSASLKFLIPFAVLIHLGSQIRWIPAAHNTAAQYATPAIAHAVEYIAAPIVIPEPRTDIAVGAIAAVWLAGMAAIAAIRLRLWLRVRSAVRASSPVDIPAPVNIRSVPGLMEPGVAGVWNPVLLLPQGITDRMTPPQLETVLSHELCHIRRRDNLFATIHMLVEAIFWFHPLVWWIGARMVDERERACDEEVLNQGNQPRIYADAILNVCKLYAESPMACVSGVTGSNIKRRIEAIMTHRRGQTLNRGKKALLAIAGFLALAGPVIVGALIGLGQVPVIHAQSPAAAGPAANRPLIAIFFDLAGSTPDEQAQARAHALNFVRQMDPADLASVTVSAAGTPRVLQDFTKDHSALETTIQNASFPSESNSPQKSSDGLMQVSLMLGRLPGRKTLLYYSLEPAQLKESEWAVRANVAVFPVVVRATGPGRASAAPTGDPWILQATYHSFRKFRTLFGTK